PLPPQKPGESREWTQRRVRTAALAHLLRGNAPAALQEWKRQPRDPRDLTERLFMVTAYNEAASEEAVPHIEKIREYQPIEADALLAHLRWRQRRGAEAYDALETSLVGYRSDPWAHFDVMRRTMTLAIDIARADPSGRHAMRLYSAMSRPFCMHLLE